MPEPARHIVLVGAMGSGKTTIGLRLATALARPFVDNDAQVVAATGMTAAEVAARDGIDALHAIEAEDVLEALRARDASVITAAASTITVPAVRTAMGRDALVVWVRADAATLAARLPRSKTRPFGDVDPAHLVARQSAERDPLFAQVADLTLHSDRETADELVARIVGVL